mmetsp:Transcript_6221/g.11550  ORF Transcript_6221/g.11550 Transcript_6221/m.11550 type:complete len:265 (+) Transcript_6221:218-1012(+)
MIEGEGRWCSGELERIVGDACNPWQVKAVVASTVGFFALQKLCGFVSLAVWPTYRAMTSGEKKKVSAWIVALFHAVLVSFMCAKLVAFPEDQLLQDRVYGKSNAANLVFTISTGYFLYDIQNCVSENGIMWPFTAHHVASSICYVLVQRPFLPYYAIWFLLYEVSTIFLNIRNIMSHSGHGSHPLMPFFEKCFGYSFILVRIGMGIPISLMAVYDTLTAYNDGKLHSVPVMVYFMIANAGLNGLNLFWLTKILAAARGKSDKKE